MVVALLGENKSKKKTKENYQTINNSQTARQPKLPVAGQAGELGDELLLESGRFLPLGHPFSRSLIN